MRARAPLRVAVGRLGTTPLLHIGCPFAAAGMNPAPIEDSFTLAAWGGRGGVVVGPLARHVLAWEVVALAAASFLPSSSLRVVRVAPTRTCVRVGPPATGSAPTRPAGLAVAGRRSSNPSRIRVERAVTRGPAGRGARCPAAAGSAQPARAGRSEPKGGWVGSKEMCYGRADVRRFEPDMSRFSLYSLASLASTLY